MKKTLTILLVSATVSAMAQTPNQEFNGNLYRYNKGHQIVGSAFIPRDTTDWVGSLGDSGRIAFKHQKLWYHNGISWQELSSGSSTGFVPTSRTISTTSPLQGGGDLSANRTLSILNAAADGSTKGAASFTANDFNATSGNISIDYANGQKATGALPGFVSTTAQTFAGDKTFTDKVYAAQLNASVPFANNTLTKIYATSNTLKDPYVRVWTWQNGNAAGLDTTSTIAFTRSNNSTVNLSDASNGYGYVLNNQMLGQLTGDGVSRDESINVSAASTINPVAKIGFYAETDFTNRSVAAGRIVFSTKSNGGLYATERVQISSAGFVGIGNASPSVLLDVFGGNMNLYNTGTLQTIFNIGTSSTNRWGFVKLMNGDATNPAGLALYEDNTSVGGTAGTRMSIKQGGIFGFNISNPTSTIQTQSLAPEIGIIATNSTLGITNFTVRVTVAGTVVTLPAASSCRGRIYVIINYNTGGNITTSAFLSSAAVSTTTIATGGKVWVQSDGSNWYQIN